MPWHTEHFPPKGVNGVGAGLRLDLTGLDFVGFMCNLFLVECPHKGYVLVLGSDVQSCTQIIRSLARFYSYDYDLRKTNYIFK